MKLLSFLILLLVGYGVLLWSIKEAREKVKVFLSFKKECTEIKEENRIHLVIENHSYLPLFYLRVSFHLPKEMNVTDEKWLKDHVISDFSSSNVVVTLYLMPHQRSTIEIPVESECRGLYVIDHCFVVVSDLFSLKQETVSLSVDARQITYPCKSDQSIPSDFTGGIIGDRSVQRWLYEDPIMAIGYNEYSGKEPMNQIAWKKSLSLDRLLVRQNDHTSSDSVMVLLDLSGGHEEACFSLCRSVLEKLEELHISWSFASDSVISDRLTSGLGYHQFHSLLKDMGAAPIYLRNSLETLLQECASAPDNHFTYVVVTGHSSLDSFPSFKQLKIKTNRAIRVLEAKE